MEELKKLQLNNRSLEQFDKLMNYHFDKIEELEINEININPKLYNLISLCTNLKQLVINGDLRTDVNKIFYNICNPENLETIILNSVKLPTIKAFTKYTNISTISLTNINFCDLIGFLNRISNPEKIEAFNFTNVDFGKRPISICKKFENLKFLNLDGIKNCIFDSFDFLFDNKKISRFEFYNNKISFKNVNGLLRGKYNKRIEVKLETEKKCNIINSLEVNDKGTYLTINTCDLEKAVDNIGFYKISNLCIIQNDGVDLAQYIRKFKNNKVAVTLAINDIRYFSVDDARKFQDKLNLQFISVLQSPKDLKLNENVQCYSIEDYVKIREAFEKVKQSISAHSSELDTFNEIYNYFKNKVKLVDEDTDLKDILIDKKSCYDFYALIINSYLKEYGFESKIIKGSISDEENHYWNQVKIKDEWYNFDLAFELRTKENKSLLKYAFKGKLFNDEQFYKTHTPYCDSKPETCVAVIQDLKKEKSIKIKSFFKKIYFKFVSMAKYNKDFALPAPKDEGKGHS